MAAELHAIHRHSWILTALLTTIMVAAGYCNYAQTGGRTKAAPYARMKDLREREQPRESRAHTSGFLKQRTHTFEILLRHCMVCMQLNDFEQARRFALNPLDASPTMRKEATTLIEMVDARLAG